MNKLSIITQGIVLALGIIKAAYAETPSSYSSLSNWTGFYAGLNAQFAFNNLQLRSEQIGFTNPSEQCNGRSNSSTLIPGIQLGYMYQFPHSFVTGVETNVTFNTNQKSTLRCRCPDNPYVSDSFSFKEQMQRSVKGRAGRTLIWNKNILLPYLTAGASFANAGLTYKNEGGDYYSKNTTQEGWLIGAGIEWSFRQHWSLRAEYSYIDYGNAIQLKLPSVYGLIDPNGNARVDLQTNNVLVAINYWI